MRKLKVHSRFVIAVISICALTILAGCGGSGAVERQGSSNSSGVMERVYKFPGALALKGYDAVAYFNAGDALQGSEHFTHEWKGANWRFASAANRDLFANEPEKYAPQYGGYCAWAVGHGYTAKGDPEAWKIVDGKLYLNYNKSVQEKWVQDIPAYIAKGDENWQRFLKEKPEHKGE